MKKYFLLPAFLLTAVFANVASAQTDSIRQTIKAQAVAFAGGGNSENAGENRPRFVVETNKASTFELERKILELINAQRETKGLEPLRWSDDVARIARIHSENMARYKFFNHVDREGRSVDDRADAIGLSKWRAIGENIAYNRGFENPVETAFAGWLKSSAHRENLLSGRWRETGIGIAVADDGTYYFTQVFLTR